MNEPDYSYEVSSAGRVRRHFTLHFQRSEDDMNLNGDSVLRFIGGIEKAMDEAGGGQFRAFRLLTELKALGLRIEADPPTAPEGNATYDGMP